MTNQPNSQSSHRRVVAGVCVVLAAAVVGLVWYVYPSLHGLPSFTQRINQSVDTMCDQVKEAEAKAADSSRSQESLRDQVTGMGHNLRARIEAASKQASQSAEDTYHKVQAQTEKIADVTRRVAGLESSREEDQLQIAQLKQQLNQVRERAEQLSVEQATGLAQLRQQMDETRAGTSEQLAAVQRDQERDRSSLDAFADQIAIQKLPFEATKNQSREVADGISLCIDNTDTEFHRVSGWIWIAGDHRTVWLRDQAAQEPVVFYGSQDGQKRELVITNVTDNSVTGYLLLPKQAAAETAPAGQ
jgi:hypothetical protein